MPLVIRYFQSEYFASGDPDAKEIFADEAGSAVQRVNEDNRRGGTQQKLLSILNHFFLHRKLYRIFVALVGHANAEVARTTLECFLQFKPSWILPYADGVKELLAKGRLRDSMMRLKENACNGKISPSDRHMMSPLLARMLLGQLSAKSVGKATKDSPSARRAAVFSFAAGFCSTAEELFPFIYLLARRYLPCTAARNFVENCGEEDRTQLISALSNISIDECKSLHEPVHEGFLNVLEAIISQLGQAKFHDELASNRCTEILSQQLTKQLEISLPSSANADQSASSGDGQDSFRSGVVLCPPKHKALIHVTRRSSF